MDHPRSASPVVNDLLLLSTAAIWGFAFVAQRVGMESVGPFLFNGIRFALGAVTLLPFAVRRRRKSHVPTTGSRVRPTLKYYAIAGSVAGIVLFFGGSLQQIGLVYTTAGKAGFITGLYVVLVPIFGTVLGHRAGLIRWLGAGLAVAGLYLLSVQSSLSIATGDIWVVGSAVFFAIHVIVLGQVAPKVDSMILALVQYVIVSVASVVVALFLESNTATGVAAAAPAIIYGGCFSVGVAYTLQILALRHAHPAHASIILSLEGVFAAVGGWLLLGETLSPRALIGCLLMLTGMITSQYASFSRSRAKVG